MPLIYTSKDCTHKLQILSIEQLIKDLEKYDSTTIEIEGYYYWGMEQSSISTKKQSIKNEARIWVDFNQDIIDSLSKNISPDDNVFGKIQGRRVKIKGIISAKEHGHLSQYAVTIKNVCYLQILD